MTDQIKKATKSDIRFAIVRASRLMDLAFEFNCHEKSTANFAGDVCCGAFRLAEKTLDIIGVNGTEVIERAVSCGECTPKLIAHFIQEIADEDAYEALPECTECGAKVQPGENCTECWTECDASASAA